MRILGRLVEYQNSFEAYDKNGHLIRPIGKIIKIGMYKNVWVKNKLSGEVTKEVLGETILFV